MITLCCFYKLHVLQTFFKEELFPAQWTSPLAISHFQPIKQAPLTDSVHARQNLGFYQGVVADWTVQIQIHFL
jgi:hypothetical protein